MKNVTKMLHFTGADAEIWDGLVEVKVLPCLMNKKNTPPRSHLLCSYYRKHMCGVIFYFFFLGPLQILTNARRGGTPVPTTRCALTWTEATTAAVPTDTTAPGTASTTARSSTAGRSGCWTTIAALSAPVR